MRVAEQLNNAIVTLAYLNPTDSIASALNDRWQDWWNGARGWAPDAAWWQVLNGFWLGYAGARLTADVTNARTPPAMDIDPNLWALLMDQGGAAVDAYKDSARASGEVIAEAAAELGKLSKSVLFVAAVAGVAIFMLRGRR